MAESNNQPIIRLKHITKSYLQKKPLLSDIGMEVDQGEFLFLTGVSGAGKSTIFRMLLGLEKPDQGEVFVNGKKINELVEKEMPFHRRKIGMVFQDYKLLPKKTVEANIAIPLQIQGRSPAIIEKRISQTARQIGIESLLKQPIASLSGGEQQLVAIARASIHSPDLVLADEPTANLDQKMAGRIISTLLALNDEGKTVIIATHDINLIKAHDKRILLIKNSEIREVH
jgi:cell division transport system ATP-binding protein